MRLFLASSRSFKYSIASKMGLEGFIKEFVVNCAMPKFVWVAEFCTAEQYGSSKACGFIVLDATAAKENMEEAILVIVYPSMYATRDEGVFKIGKRAIPQFRAYSNNLIEGGQHGAQTL